MRRIIGIGLIVMSVITGVLLAVTGHLAPTRSVATHEFVVGGIFVHVADIDADLNWWIALPLLAFFIIGLASTIIIRRKRA